MLRIRFLRIGKKNSPSFRLVVTEKTAPPKGKFLEVVGFYNPGTKDWGLKSERAAYWMEKGAQPSDTAHNFLVKHGSLKGPKIAVHAKPKQEASLPADLSVAASLPVEVLTKDEAKEEAHTISAQASPDDAGEEGAQDDTAVVSAEEKTGQEESQKEASAS